MRRCVRESGYYTRYGPPDVVEIADVEKPVPNDDEVLIAIRAASINAFDWRAIGGTPFLVRMMFGLRRPKDTRLGVDVSGRGRSRWQERHRVQAGRCGARQLPRRVCRVSVREGVRAGRSSRTT